MPADRLLTLVARVEAGQGGSCAEVVLTSGFGGTWPGWLWGTWAGPTWGLDVPGMELYCGAHEMGRDIG